MSYKAGRVSSGNVLFIGLSILALLFLYCGNADAFETLYNTNCVSCHPSPTPSTCAGCHAHGVHSSSAKSDINLTATTDKATYTPGETLTVQFTGGYRAGWVRAYLYDNVGVQVDVSTGTNGLGGGATFPGPITLTGTAPAAAGTYTFTAAWYGNAYDATGATFGPNWTPDPGRANHGQEKISTNSFTVSASTAPTISTASPLPAGTVGTAYDQPLAATGGTLPYSWSVTAGSGLPAGLSLSAAGVLSGTPTTAGTFNFSVTVTGGGTASKDFSLTINPVGSPTISTASPLPAGTVGTAYNQPLAATGGTTPYSWSVSAGALPAGLSLSAAGVLSGTPTTAGTFNFSVTVTGGGTASKDFSLTINPVGAPTITTAGTLPTGTVGTAYNQPLAATGGTTPYSWSVSAGALPSGLSLSAAGVLSGTPTAAGTSSFTVQVTGGGTSTKDFDLTIDAAGSVSGFGGGGGGGGCAISPSGGGNGGILGTYGPLILLAIGIATRRRVRRRKE